MQSSCTALAVAGLMSGAAFAQSNVTVYGQAREERHDEEEDHDHGVCREQAVVGVRGDDLGSRLGQLEAHQKGERSAREDSSR